jgi:hypothetical protein
MVLRPHILSVGAVPARNLNRRAHQKPGTILGTDRALKHHVSQRALAVEAYFPIQWAGVLSRSIIDRNPGKTQRMRLRLFGSIPRPLTPFAIQNSRPRREARRTLTSK